MIRTTTLILAATLATVTPSIAQVSLPAAAQAALTSRGEVEALEEDTASTDILCVLTLESSMRFFRNHGDPQSAARLQADYDRYASSLGDRVLYGLITESQYQSEVMRISNEQSGRGEYAYLQDIARCSVSFRWR